MSFSQNKTMSSIFGLTSYRIIVYILLLFSNLTTVAQGTGTFNLQVTGTQTCAGGLLTFSPSGQTGIVTYTVSSSTFSTTTQDSTLVVPSGTFSVTGLDAAFKMAGPVSVTISGNTIPNFISLVENEICGNDGSITVELTEGVTESLQLCKDSVLVQTISNPTRFTIFDTLIAGDYQVKAIGCVPPGQSFPQQMTKDIIVLNKPPGLSIQHLRLNDILPYCDSITTVFRIQSPINTNIAYPLSYKYTITPPLGGASVIITYIVHDGTETSHNIRFYHDQEYSYSLVVTDNCNMAYAGGTFIVNKKYSMILTAVAQNCGNNRLGFYNQWGKDNFNYMFLEYPPGYDTVNYNSIDLIDGRYIVKATDMCNHVSIDTLRYTKVALGPINTFLQNAPGCDDGFGSIRLRINNPFTRITSATIIQAPSEFSFPIPYHLTTLNAIENGIIQIGNIPAGNYRIIVRDTCGRIDTRDYNVVGYELNGDIEIRQLCGSFELINNFSDNANLQRKYSLENFKDGTWMAVQDLGEGSSGSIQLTGQFRIVRFYTIYGIGGTNQSCSRIIKHFNYSSSPMFNSIAGFNCDDGSKDVIIDATGMDQLFYRITSGPSGPINNGENPVFTGLSEGVYTFAVEDICPNRSLLTIELTKLAFPFITPDNLCEGETGRLNIQGFAFLNYEWSKSSNPNIILSTTNSLEFAPFTSSVDAGEYRVRVTYPGSCLDTLLKFVIPTSFSLPNAGQNADISLCNQDSIVDLRSYIGNNYDTYGRWESIGSEGNLIGSQFIIDSLPDGLYAFRYVVPGLCAGSDTSFININLRSPSVICESKDIMVIVDASGVVNILPEEIDNGSFSTCGPFNLSVSQSSFNCNQTSPVLIDLIVSDTYGNTKRCPSNVTIIDTFAPQCPIFPSTIIVDLEPGKCDKQVFFNLPLGIDNCGVSPISTTIPGQPRSGDRFTQGTHIVEYLVTDSYGNSTKCSFNIIVNPKPVVTIGQTICQYGSVTLNANGSGMWTSQLNNAGTSIITSPSNPVTTITNFSDPGVYYFVWNASGCTDKFSLTVTPKPNAGANQAVCQSGTATMAAIGNGVWSIAAGSISASTINSPSSPTTTISNFTKIGNYNFVWTEAGCSDTAAVIVLLPNAGPNQIACQFQSTYMAAKGDGVWTADPGNPGIATIVSPTNPRSLISNFSTPGTYNFIWTVLGCTDTASVTVIPKPNAGNDQAGICAGSSATLTGIIPNDGDWLAQNGNPLGAVVGSTNNGIAMVAFSNSAYGIYNFIYSSDGCSDTISIDRRPIIICPPNKTVNILTPLECDTTVTWDPVTVIDNCNILPFDTIRIGLNLDKNRGDNFSVGVYPITYQVTDASGDTNSCSFDIVVNDFRNPFIGCKNVNLSLDEDCEGELAPTEVLTGWEHPSGIPQLGCLDLYDINIKGKNGEDLGNTVGNDQLGKTLKYTITNVNGFICWGDVTVEDKIKPTIICPTVPLNVDCLTDISKIAPPAVDDNCSGAKAVLVNEVHEALQCDANYIGRVTKTWKAVDGAGNESVLLCVQVINLERSSTIGITAPPRSWTLECSDDYARDNKGLGYPSPSVTGVPVYNGITPLYPLSQLNMLYCNSTIDYTDVLILDTKCKKRILRTWNITEWWCSTAVSKFVSMQTIDIVDTTAPVIPAQDDITVTTQTRSCSATVLLPVLTITDNCTAVYKVYVNAYLDGVPTGYINGNGGSITLVSGVHTITYSALDECGNQRDMSYRITVQDDTDPVAICDQFATISIKTNGYTEITAQAIDDGSFDECGAVTLKVRRMEDPCDFGADEGWYDKVGFCCLDANTTRMVQLLVTDAGGNTNICMVSVNVQDKVDPVITCLPDITINDCQYTFDPQNPAAYFGEIVIDDNCPANNQLREVVTDNRNQCGIGTVVRTTSVIGGGITYQTCVQTITFRNNDPFYINDADHTDPTDDIEWPADYTALGQCSVLGLDPAITGQPIFTEDACDLVGMRYHDVVYPFTTNGACFKIIRTWTVIDWCQTDKDGNHLTWSHDQEIRVMDNVIPTITSATTPKLVLTYDGECQDGQIVLTASATDCTPANELRWSWVVTKGGIVFRTGVSNVASGTYPIGIYKIEFTVEDKCGNLAKTGYDFEIRNAKAPTAICKQGLSASLGLMDSDGNGIGDTIMTILKPGYFDNKSSHVCGYPLKLSFSSDVNDTIATFSCADRGPQTIQMWVTDVNGNTSYCQTFVDIQDEQGLCPTMILANVSGKTVKEDNTEIEDVIVEMKGSELNPLHTDREGHYAFAPMATGGSYQVIPGKDGDDMNGVSTLDIVMIQRHILGMEKLNSPYKLIAADANNSGSITASDLTELRKLVLGLTMSLPNNTSWRFVDAAYQFVDKNDPWLTPFAERYNIDALTGHMDINFVGIKVGDVNGNAKGRNISGSTIEKRSKVNVLIDDRKVEKGDIIDIPVMMESGQTIYGLQSEWQTRGLIIREMREGALEINGEAYVIRDVHHSGMSILIPEGKMMDRNEVMFVIEVEAIRSGRLSDMIQLSETVTPEIYVTDMETRVLGISWRTKTETDFRVTGTTPNPWNTNTNITFELPKDGMVTFKVKDYTGRKVISTIDQYGAGQNTIQLSRSDVGHSGVYVYELRYGDKVISGKMILID